jgi:hypothetical protein
MSSAVTKIVKGYLQHVPDDGVHHRDCMLATEKRNHGTHDQSMSPVIIVSHEIADPADDFPDGNYSVSFDGGYAVGFVKSNGKYSEVR